jgi:hypothetical protein
MRRATLLLLAVLLLAGCAHAPVRPTGMAKVATRGYVNPTPMAGPSNVFDNMFVHIPKADATVAQANAVYHVLGRPNLTPASILTEHNLINGKEVAGYDFYYGDKIMLAVMPSPDGLGVDYWLAQRPDTNTAGVSAIYSATTVRGLPAVQRDQGVQAFADGATNAYPADLIWAEKGNAQVPYLIYTLSGDLPVAALKDIAKSLN